MQTQDNNSENTNDQSCLSAVSSSDIYWIINQNTYNVDGVEVPKGRIVKMNKKTATNIHLYPFTNLVELSFFNKIFVKPKILFLKTPQKPQA